MKKFKIGLWIVALLALLYFALTFSFKVLVWLKVASLVVGALIVCAGIYFITKPFRRKK